MKQRLLKCKDDREIARIMTKLGFVYLKLGEFKQSLIFYKSALEMNIRLYPSSDENDLIAKSLNVSQETKEQIITKGAIKITPRLSSVIIGIILLIGVLIYKNYSPTTNININFSL